MSLNDDQKDYVRSLAKIPAEEKCDCGWYRVDECHCDDANKYAKARQQWLRFYRELNEARAEIRQLRETLTEVHWWCGREGITEERRVREILDSLRRTLASDSQRSEP